MLLAAALGALLATASLGLCLLGLDAPAAMAHSSAAAPSATAIAARRHRRRTALRCRRRRSRHHAGACVRGSRARHARASARRRRRLARLRYHRELARLATSACPGASSLPEPANLAEIRAAVLCLVDRERARNGDGPLRFNRRMQAAAQHHSDDMAARGYFEHEGPGGETVADRLRATGWIYSSRIGYAIGENIAWGTLTDATPEAVVAAWMASPEHRANILDRRYRATGIGVAPEVPSVLGEGEPGAMYTQDFGVIIPA